jgi:TorA maturation chaperone TorD
MSKTKIIEDIAEVARERSHIYGFLATIYHKELTGEQLRQIREPRFLETLSEYELQLEDDFLKTPEEKLLEELAVEYCAIFIGPAKNLSPHESLYHEREDIDWGRFWGKDTVLVKKYIEWAGLKYKPEFTGMPDHISVELEFMQQLAKREAKAWRAGKVEEARHFLKKEKQFMADHLAAWVPLYCDKVVEFAKLSFTVSKLPRSEERGIHLQDSKSPPAPKTPPFEKGGSKGI